MKLKTLIVGVSRNPNRYANRAVKVLEQNGYECIGLGKDSFYIEGFKVHSEFPLSTLVDTVTLYINPKLQEDYKKFIIKLNPRRVIFNSGTENPAFEQMLSNKGIETLNACTLVLLATNQY